MAPPVSRAPWPARGRRRRPAGAGTVSQLELCCADQLACAASSECSAVCQRLQFNRERFIGADAGFFYKWELEEGLPRGCEGFRVRGKWVTEEQAITIRGRRDPACPRQDLSDGEGMKLSDTVEFFSENQQEWVRKFVASFVKMSANGYQDTELHINQLEKSFWKHLS